MRVNHHLGFVSKIYLKYFIVKPEYNAMFGLCPLFDITKYGSFGGNIFVSRATVKIFTEVLHQCQFLGELSICRGAAHFEAGQLSRRTDIIDVSM